MFYFSFRSSPAVYFLSHALDGLWRENTAPVNRLYSTHHWKPSTWLSPRSIKFMSLLQAPQCRGFANKLRSWSHLITDETGPCLNLVKYSRSICDSSATFFWGSALKFLHKTVIWQRRWEKIATLNNFRFWPTDSLVAYKCVAYASAVIIQTIGKIDSGVKKTANINRIVYTRC